MVSALSITTNQCLTSHSSSVAQIEPLCPRKIPLYVCLSDRLSNPAEVACAEAVASYLSFLCGRGVALTELEGLSLYLLSEDDLEGRILSNSISNVYPFQALLLKTRQRTRECLVSDEFMPFVGQWFAFNIFRNHCLHYLPLSL